MTTAADLQQSEAIVAKNVRHAGRPVLVVWLVLVATTMLSYYLGDGHGTTKLAAVVVVVSGFVKVALIGEHFMELRTAPPQLRFAFLGYCVLVPTVLVVIFLSRS